MITAGADINKSDIYGNTSLHYLCIGAHKNALYLLLKKPSLNLNIKNGMGQKAYDLLD